MQSRQLWLYRTKPKDDELLSSWLVRLAHGLAIKLQPFCTQVLGQSPGFWTGDVDRHLNHELLHLLSDGAGVPAERLTSVGLSAYAGYLWDEYRPTGSLPWVMPIGRHGRRRTSHGQQFCRRCLAEDHEPYFRRRWRLALYVVCERHRIYLDDACRSCGAPVEFHANDYGKRLLDLECPITKCPECGQDHRFGEDDSDLIAPTELAEFQATIGKALLEGWSEALPGAKSYSFLAFDGLRLLVRLLCSRSHGERLRTLMQADGGWLPLSATTSRARPVFEELRIGERAEILNWCHEFLGQWPDKFVWRCHKARVASSYIRRYGAVTRYWLDTVIQWQLYDGDYAPCEQEKAAVATWLARQGVPVTENAIRRWLGVSHTDWRRPEVTSSLSRWNPRGASRAYS